MPAPLRRRARKGGPRSRAIVDDLGRALAVLRCLAAHGPQTVAELAERTGLHLRAAYRWIERIDAAGIPIRQTAGWPLRYHIDVLDLMRWIAGARG